MFKHLLNDEVGCIRIGNINTDEYINIDRGKLNTRDMCVITNNYS